MCRWQDASVNCGKFADYSGCKLFVAILLLVSMTFPQKILLGAEPTKLNRLRSWLTLPKSPSGQHPSSGKVRPSSNLEFVPAKATTETTSPAKKLTHPGPRSGRAELSNSTPRILPVRAQTVNEESPNIVPANANDVPIPAETPPVTEPVPSVDINSAITLERLTELADMHHPRLTVAYQRVQAARGKAWQAGRYPNPKIAISSPQVDGNESQYNGFISQEFVTAGKLKLNVAAAQREVSQAEYAWQQERFYVLTDLRQKFFATLAAQRRVAILESLVKIASRSHASSEKLLQAGEGSRGDTLLLGIELRRAEVALKNAQTITEIGKQQLALLVAVPDLTIASLDGDLDAPTRQYDLNEVRYAVSTVNPQANIARLEIDRTAYLLQRACVEPVPNLEIMGGYQRQVGVPAQDQGLFQVSMSIPIWNRNQGNISAAQADQAAAQADLQRVELQLANLAADAVSTFRTACQLVEQYDTEILPKARETLEISQSLYAQGQIDFLRLLQSQRTLLESELARVEAQQQRWVAAAALAGLLQEQEFPLVTAD